jgi:hypothetical protein
MLKLYRGEWPEADKIIHDLIADPQLPLICQTTTFVAKGRLQARRGGSGVAETLDKALKISQKINNLQRAGVVYTARAEAAGWHMLRRRLWLKSRHFTQLPVKTGSRGLPPNWLIGAGKQVSCLKRLTG